MSSVITRILATPVCVPARADSVNSPGIVDEDKAFAVKFKTGGKWSEFASQTKWILEAETADGAIGLGESYRNATREAMEKLMGALLGLDVLAADWRRLPVEDVRAYDAAESAVLDLAGKLLKLPVCQLLGGATTDRVECSGWTGRRTPADAARKAHEAMQRGHRVFKFKCSSEDSIAEWIHQIRARCGDQMRMILDPNQRWHDVATSMRMMQGVPAEAIYGLEDPVERKNYAAFRELRQRLRIPIFVHIAVPYLHQGQRASDILDCLRERCADGFNFNGPMFEFVRLASIAELEGLTCWHGSEVDLGILEASALHACAASPLCVIPSDIFGELVREDDLIVEPIRFEKGCALVPTGPGLGVELDREALARFRSGETLELHR